MEYFSTMINFREGFVGTFQKKIFDSEKEQKEKWKVK